MEITKFQSQKWKLCEINFTKYCQFFVCEQWVHSGNYGILLPATVFSQIFRQINALLENFTVNQFDEKKNCLAVNFSFFHTAQCTGKINSWKQLFSNLSYLVKTFLLRNFCQNSVRVSFRNFNTVHWKIAEIYSHTFNLSQKFRQTNQ